MCGFVGFTGLREQREAILHRMADRIIHRGPDMEGYHISGDDPRTAIALGFRRLSIIDLAAGKQPMYNEDGTVVCVFNGEIYNFMDLRTELQAKGHIFKTHCDTEVIIHGYEEYGTALAAKLRGMFAFVVWDTKTNEMYGARDIFGIKPFYYTQTEAGELLFGSEISIGNFGVGSHKFSSRQTVFFFLLLGFICLCIRKNIRNLLCLLGRPCITLIVLFLLGRSQWFVLHLQFHRLIDILPLAEPKNQIVTLFQTF